MNDTIIRMETPTEQAETLFGRALEVAAGPARDAFLNRECGGDTALLREVQSLLQAHERADAGFMADDSTPHLPGYQIEHKLGSGGLGTVYAAQDQKLKRRVAIKVLRARASQPARQRVLEEARKLAVLNDPGVVTIYSVLDDTSPPAIVMELVEGFPIDRFAEQLTFQQKAILLREIARSLAVAHARGLVHRDLKPDNILVGPDMRPRILDFGLALLPEERAAQTGVFAGSPLYASPEQVACKAVGPASDIFSFGSLMFKLLTGQSPFTGGSVTDVLKAVSAAKPPFPRELALGVPEDLQAICLCCLALDPADRPTASQVALELERFLMGEPVRLRPKLYQDLLQSGLGQYSAEARVWRNQDIISREECDALEGFHRRLRAEEDHWIIDARRITLLQTILSAGTWLSVVASVLTVWLLRDDLGAPGRWLLPLILTVVLLGAGFLARKSKDDLAAATFLAGAVLGSAPCCLALLGELGIWAQPQPNVTQLFEGVFTNQQVFVAGWIALGLSILAWWRLKFTGFAWTSATMLAAAYIAGLLLFNWLDKRPEIQALWCLPLVFTEPIALALEKRGRVRWTLPFHLLSLLALVGCLDAMAANGPTLRMLGVTTERVPFFDSDRLKAFSFFGNGIVLLILMLVTEHARSLDLRRGSKLLEVIAILHILSPLFINAMNHRNAPHVRIDVWIYISVAVTLICLAPLRSRWRMLVGGLAGCGLGSYLLVDLALVSRKPFILTLGSAGLLIALATFFYVQTRGRHGLPWSGFPLRAIKARRTRGDGKTEVH